MDIKSMPQYVLEAVRARLGADETDESNDARIAQMTPNELFIEFCEWEGLVNCGQDLLDTIDRLRGDVRRDDEPPTAVIETSQGKLLIEDRLTHVYVRMSNDECRGIAVHTMLANAIGITASKIN